MPNETETNKIEMRFQAVSTSKTFRNLRRAYGLEQKAVLDIGCSYGEYLSHFGPGSTGITINPEEAVEGRSRGLDMRVGNAEDELPIEKNYDAIYCSNLLEHLYSPHAFLYRARKALGPGGTLILGVPVLPFPRFLTRFKKFHGALAGAHINFFVKDSLAYTVQRAGWHIKCIRGFHFSNVILDSAIWFLYPHLYVIAEPDLSFSYGTKREKELAGYGQEIPR
jgi:SAM-dependent methyltransferase